MASRARIGEQQPFVVDSVTDARLQHPIFPVIERVRSFENASLTNRRRRCLTPGAEVFSDGLGCFWRGIELSRTHPMPESAYGRVATKVNGVCWGNVSLGNVEKAFRGCYHAMRRATSARCYLTEVPSFNRRFRLNEQSSRLARAMTLWKPWSEPNCALSTNFYG